MNYELRHRTHKKLSNGKFYPLGATLQEGGVNFALYSKHAKEVYLLLFPAARKSPSDIIQLQCSTRNIWHCFVHGIKAGQLYAYKVKGDYQPAQGFRFNENKLLIDPYAKALTGKCINQDGLLFGYDPQAEEKDLSFDRRDNSEIVPKSIVIDDKEFDWQGDLHPDIPLDETIIYEVHLKGFTAHPSSGVKHPGTYAGFSEKIPYLKELGINAVGLLPVHEFYTEDNLAQRNLTNYWGYNTLCYFAPEFSYSSQKSLACQVNEFKTLVRQLHKAGIEVLLDVVFNHSGEGDQLGPTLTYRGIDNLSYYYLKGAGNEPGRYYLDYTGCGNSLNASNAPVLRMIMDSLRYWVEQMHVDGFRFDLASVLGRESGNFLKTASFFDALSQDPILSRIKLVAEPWDIGTYQLGNFPVDWAEWNGQFRDTMRKFIKGDAGQLRNFSKRIAGSLDIYRCDGRTAFQSINFITCHDGFTMYDLVSYREKHNLANAENNTDGLDENNSWNWGAEGPTDDLDILNLRKQLIKNFACCLFLAGGTSMLLGGDEFCRTQKGNNNAYCQDNEISWFNWRGLEKNKDIFSFFKKIIQARKYYRILKKKEISYGQTLPALISWYGTNLNSPDWENPEARTLCFLMQASEPGMEKYDYFTIFNADYRSQEVKLPQFKDARKWQRIIDTSLKSPDDFVELTSGGVLVQPADSYLVNPRSVVLLVGR
jgi:glycogen operon protein